MDSEDDMHDANDVESDDFYSGDTAMDSENDDDVADYGYMENDSDDDLEALSASRQAVQSSISFLVDSNAKFCVLCTSDDHKSLDLFSCFMIIKRNALKLCKLILRGSKLGIRSFWLNGRTE